NVLHVTDFKSVFPYKVTVHTSCSALREYGLAQEPFILLQNVSGIELVELPDAEVCCGFGGTFSMKQTAISTAMVEQKVHHALSTGASYITSTEYSCLMNIQAYIAKNNIPLKVIHIVDILAHKL
ncbi:MAG: (Fe-S)-binding protein, partial [Bacteroidales bacterium]